MRLDGGDEFTVVWEEEFVEMLFGEHGAMVITHVLRKRHEFDIMVFVDFFEYLKAEIRLVAVHAVEELRLVVERIKVRLDTEEGARKPEEAFECHPEGDIAVFVFLLITVIHVPSDGVGVVERFLIMVLDVFLHGRKDGAAERLWLGKRAGTRSKPLLDKRIQAKVLHRLDTVHAGGEAFAKPSFDGEIPPAGPFDAGEAVCMLEIEDCFDSFTDIHGIFSI